MPANSKVKEGIGYYPGFHEFKDEDLNIKYIYSDPTKYKHEYTLIIVPKGEWDVWNFVWLCEDWKLKWEIKPNYRMVIPRNIGAKNDKNEDYDHSEYIAKRREQLMRLMDKEKNKFEDQNPRRIVVGGMHAGGIVTLAAFTKYCAYGNQLGGVFCLSGIYSNPEANYPDHQLDTIRQIPLLLYHGVQDKVIPLSASKESY